MQTIYEFKVRKEVEQEVKKETDNGVLVTQEKIEKPINILFKKPNRLESEEADVISAVEFSESIRKGILTKPLLEKLYDEKGGFLAENYEDKQGKLLARFYEVENEYRRLTLKEEKSADDKEKINAMAAEFVTVRNSLQSLEASRNNLFQNTAENRAQNKTIFWLTLFLTYVQENENEPATPFFESKATDFKTAFEQKRDDYDKKVEEDSEFFNQVIDKTSLFVSLWYLGRASTKEDFKRIEETLLTPTIQPKAEEDEKSPEEPATDDAAMPV